MIIKTLTLANFGVYLGTHEFDLAPASPNRPIILFGGHNGGGKTTLLDAIQLALFGKLSRCSTRGTLSYEEFLRRSISRTASEGETATVGLSITQIFDGESHDFVIKRSWARSGKGVTETFVVIRDNVVDPDLAEHWLEHVDQFIPVGLAELFFFDGEQIARLAESENAAQMLSTAINTLLGIDLVDRLERDLLVYERETAKSREDTEITAKIASAEREIEGFKAQQNALAFEKGKLLGDLDRAKRRVETIEHNFRRQGGDLFGRRKQLAAQLDGAKQNLSRVETELREIASGPLPLVLLRRSIEAITQQAEKENQAETQKLVISELKNRDRAILSQFRRESSTDLVQRLDAILTRDRANREQQSVCHSYLRLDKSTFHALHLIGGPFFEQIADRVNKLAVEHRSLSGERRRIEEVLAQVPDEKAIAQIAEQLAEGQRSVVKCEAEWALVNSRFEELGAKIAAAEKALAGTLEKNAAEVADREDSSRKIRFSSRVRETMRLFRMRVLDRKLRQIEGLILDSFQQLARKSDLVTSIRIDPDSYTMSLYTRGGEVIHANRLSAGERQLLAVSTLWGLARASGRPLPTIIDTPLGRLDSVHRARLVNSYFPYASHQVIILSTDEEIGQNHLETLRPRITRSFELMYSSDTTSTAARSGYFFN